MEYQSGAVRPGDSISEGWNIIKNDYWMYVLMIFLMIVIVIIVAMILGAINGTIINLLGFGLGAATKNGGGVAQASSLIIPQVVAQVTGFFVNVIVSTLFGIMLCGLYKSLSKVANTQSRAEFGDLFSGFENVQACFIYALIISAIQFVIGIVMLLIAAAAGVSVLAAGLSGMITKDGINPALLGGVFLALIVFLVVWIFISLIIGALTAFVYPLIGERNLSGVQAFTVSIRSGFSNIFGLILLIILLGLMAFVAAIPCGLGIPFLAPILIAALFAAYRSVFGRPQNDYQYNPPTPPTFGNQPGGFGNPGY